MMLVTAELKGLDRIEADLVRREAMLIEGVDKALGTIAGYGADLMRERMQMAPSPSPPGGAPGTVTGNLIRSVRSEHQAGSLTAIMRAGTKGRKKGGAPHWFLLEFGTMRMAARPFIRPAGKQAAEHGRHLIDAVVRAVANGR